jgi:hypothetical protein
MWMSGLENLKMVIAEWQKKVIPLAGFRFSPFQSVTAQSASDSHGLLRRPIVPTYGNQAVKKGTRKKT